MGRDETRSTDSALGLTDDQLISLLGHYLSTLPPRWRRLQNYVNIYTSIIVAILIATIGGFKLLSKGPISLLLLFGPVLALVLAEFAKRTVNRQHKHIKELIVMTAKLEYEIGLYGLPKSEHGPDEWKPFPDDPTFIVPAWARSRKESGHTSDDFIDEFKWSSAKLTHRLFMVLQGASAILALVIIGFTLL